MSFRSGKGPKGLTDAVYGCEKLSGKKFLVVFKTVHLQQLKGMHNSKVGNVKGVSFDIRRYIKGVTFLSWYMKG